MPNFIPYGHANRTYEKEWKGWGDYLSTNTVATNFRKYLSYSDAKKELKKLNIKTWKEFKKLHNEGKIRNDIPRAPNMVYRKHWKNAGDFFGTGLLPNQDIEFLSFEDAKKNLKKLKLKTVTDYHLAKKNKKVGQNIPHDASKFYRKKWKGWPNFLGKI